MKKNEKLLNAMSDIEENMIMEAQKTKSKTISFKAWAGVATAAVIAFMAFSLNGTFKADSNEDNNLGVLPQQPSIGDTTPLPRGTFFFNNYKYAQNDNLIPEQFIQLDTKIGEISAQEAVDPAFASALAQGGDVYSLVGLSQDFALAISNEKGVFVCQVVDNAAQTGLNLKEYFAVIDLENTYSEVSIFSFFQQEFLNTLSSEDALWIIQTTANATVATLANEDYEKLAKLQNEDKAFTVSIALENGLAYDFTAIPEMGLVIVGDCRYSVSPDALEKMQTLFQF